MSQSDYIRFKKIATKLSIDSTKTNNKEHPVFDSGDYIDFKQFDLENNIINTSPTFNYIVPEGHQIIFGMDMDVSYCSHFIDCSNTDLRPNRLPMLASQFTPTPPPLDWKKSNSLKKQRFLNCHCNTSLFN